MFQGKEVDLSMWEHELTYARQFFAYYELFISADFHQTFCVSDLITLKLEKMNLNMLESLLLTIKSSFRPCGIVSV